MNVIIIADVDVTGKAEIMSIQCEKFENLKVDVGFLNNYGGTVSVVIFKNTSENYDHRQEAMSAICDIADNNKINLVLADQLKNKDQEIENRYENLGFISKNGQICRIKYVREKTFNPSKHKFIFKFHGSCYKESKGECPLESKCNDLIPSKREGYDYSIADGCRLLENDMKEDRDEAVRIYKKSCGHYEFGDGQHRICIAKKRGWIIAADTMEEEGNCAICESYSPLIVRYFYWLIYHFPNSGKYKIF